MTDKADAIRDLVSRLLIAARREGAITESLALEIERQWRMENDGRRISVSFRRVDESQLADAVRAEYLADQPVEQITSRHGISRATLYRYIKR